MQSPRGLGAKSKGLDAALVEAAAVAVMISGMSILTHPRAGGGVE